MSMYGWFQRPGETGFGYNSTAEEVTEGLDLSGKTYLLTGCNSGLGGETMRVLCARGARVIGAARSIEKATAACDSVSGDAVPLACELSEPASVRAAVATVLDTQKEPIDGIIANAGIMALPKPTLKFGLELQFLTNHIGHYLLVTGLVDRLAEDGRVVMLSSSAHGQTYKEGIRLDDLDAKGGYTSWGAYGQSKLSNLLFARQLAKRLKPGQTANSVHPGVIPTNLSRHMPKAVQVLFGSVGPALVLKTVGQGAATQTYVAAHPGAAKSSGEYWADCNITKSSAHGQDDGLAAELWEKTEELVAGL